MRERRQKKSIIRVVINFSFPSASTSREFGTCREARSCCRNSHKTFSVCVCATTRKKIPELPKLSIKAFQQSRCLVCRFQLQKWPYSHRRLIVQSFFLPQNTRVLQRMSCIAVFSLVKITNKNPIPKVAEVRIEASARQIDFCKLSFDPSGFPT